MCPFWFIFVGAGVASVFFFSPARWGHPKDQTAARYSTQKLNELVEKIKTKKISIGNVHYDIVEIIVRIFVFKINTTGLKGLLLAKKKKEKKNVSVSLSWYKFPDKISQRLF